MRVVLGEGPDAGHAAEFARLLPAIDRAEFGQADGQIAVGMFLAGKNLDVMRTIHRLEQVAVDLARIELVGKLAATAPFLRQQIKGFALHDGRILGILVVGKMAARAVEPELADVGCEDLAVTLAGQLAADKVLQFLPNDRAVGRPENEPLPDFLVDMEEAHVAAQLAVVALFRLFQHAEMGLHLGLVLESGAVDALELRVLFVTEVVGAGDMGELERADIARAHDVRPGAEIDEIAVGIERDFLALGNAIEDIELEPARHRAVRKRGETARFAQLHRLVARNRRADKGLVRLHHRLHLGLDPLKVGRRNPVRQIDVVIKAGLHRRTGGELGLGPDFQQGGRQHMGGGMANAFEVGHERDADLARKQRVNQPRCVFSSSRDGDWCGRRRGCKLRGDRCGSIR